MSPFLSRDYQPLHLLSDDSNHSKQRTQRSTSRTCSVLLGTLIRFAAIIDAILALVLLTIARSRTSNIVVFPLVCLSLSLFTNLVAVLLGCSPWAMDVWCSFELINFEWRWRNSRPMLGTNAATAEQRKGMWPITVWFPRIWDFLLSSLIFIGTGLTCSHGFYYYNWSWNFNNIEDIGKVGAVFAFETA